MTDFLLSLGKLNLAIGAAIILVYFLRRPLRTLFGASIAYAIWLLVPIAGLASFLPPRVAALSPVHLTRLPDAAAPMSVISHIAHPALHVAEHLAEQSPLMHPAVAAQAAASGWVMPDYPMLLFVAWVLGAILMALYLARLQARFHAAVRSEEAGPAVLGFFRPRIVIPDSFQEQFTQSEQAAILEHEQVHLDRQDARVNALAALLRCFCWFNPAVHLGVSWLRIDQELACDAAAMARLVSRRDYANALVKSQLMVTALPLGCNWPGSEHPLIERVELLKRKYPGRARRIIGTALVMLVTTFAGLGAWAAQPPAVKKLITRPQLNDRVALVTPRAATVAPNRDAYVTGSNQAAANTNPTSFHEASPSRHLSRLLAARKLVVPSPDLSMLLPRETLLTPQPISTRELPPTPTQLASNATSPQVAQAAPAAQTSAARTCALPKIADSVALEEIPGTDLMTVPVKINGTLKHFLLDIGTNPTEVSQATVAQLGLPQIRKQGETIGAGGTNMGGLTSVNRSDLSSLTNGGLRDVPLYDVNTNQGSGALTTPVRIASFTIGGATARNLVFLVANDAEMGSQSEPYDGFLTGDFFKQYDVELDFGRKQINWLTPTTCTDPNQVVFWSHSAVAAIPMTLTDGKMVVPVTIQGHEINAVIDTSSSRTLMRRDIAELVLGLNPDTGMKRDGDLMDGKGQPVYVHTFPRISFAGGVTANNVPALILTNSLTHRSNDETILGSRARSSNARIPELTLGMDVLHQLHLYVVPGQGRIYVTSAEQS